MAIDGPAGNSGATIGAWVQNSSLTGSQFVPFNANGDGTFHTRVDWPYAPGAKFDLVMRFDASGWTDCAGSDFSDTDQYLLTNVKVHNVRAHNTNDGSHITGWTVAGVSTIFDNISTAIPGSSSSTVDGIHGQCGALQANGTDKVQWRRVQTNAITIAAGCSDLSQEVVSGSDPDCDGTCRADCKPFDDCLISMMNAAGQTDNSDAHFYIIDSVGCTTGGISLNASDGRRIVVIDDNWNPSSGFSEHSSRILAHEFGHSKGLGHVNGGPLDDCSDPLFSRNLMCKTSGRIMVDSPIPANSQCDIVYGSTRYTDRN